jgi:serine/threonine protein kinase
MATVYLAGDPRMDRQVALKIMLRELTANPDFAVRFKREAKVVAKLEHKAIVPIHDYAFHEGQLIRNIPLLLCSPGPLPNWRATR